MNKHFLVTMAVLSVAMPLSAGASTVPVTADAPASKCVTASSIGMQKKAEAKFEADVKAHEKNPKAEAAIAKYKIALEVAWAAMNDQYCGYGAYGATSAIKSYGKSIERARLAFLSDLKNPSDVKESTTKEPIKIVPKETKLQKRNFRSGLRRGMRSDSIKELQAFLGDHFGIAEENRVITGYFGPVTEGLVKKYQKEKHIIESDDDDGAGLVGPRTSKALNAED